MSQNVKIKGTKSGIILDLNPDIPFDELRVEIVEKFVSAREFLGSNQMGLTIKGRKLSEAEEEAVLKIISDNSDIKIVCIVTADDKLDEIFSRYISQSDETALEKRKKELDEKEEYYEQITAKQQEELENQAKLLKEMQDQLGSSAAQIYKGNLRSGQAINCESSVIVLGDVKPGASITTYGSVFVLGSLRGSAFAGASGDKSAFVMALDLNPLQVRIADSIAISPDTEKEPKLLLRRSKKKVDLPEPEVACIEGGHIVKKLYGRTFLRTNAFIS